MFLNDMIVKIVCLRMWRRFNRHSLKMIGLSSSPASVTMETPSSFVTVIIRFSLSLSINIYLCRCCGNTLAIHQSAVSRAGAILTERSAFYIYIHTIIASRLIFNTGSLFAPSEWESPLLVPLGFTYGIEIRAARTCLNHSSWSFDFFSRTKERLSNDVNFDVYL